MSSPPSFGDGLCDAVKHYLVTNNLKSLGQINRPILSELATRYYDHFQEQQKARKKRGDATPEEIEIYEAYPRREARGPALAAIRESLRKVAPVVLRQACENYRRCVGRWPQSYRYKDGRDLVPLPATWFNAERYLNDQKHWLPAGMLHRDDDTLERNGPNAGQHQSLAEPPNWKAALTDHDTLAWAQGRDWASLNHFYQKQIATLLTAQ